MLRRFFNNKFIRNVSLLVSGSAFAHIISFLMLPVLTRIYSPSEYGVMGLFSAMLITITLVSSLRYDVAIPLPKSKLAGTSLVILSLLILVATSFILFLAIYFSSSFLLSVSTFNKLGALIWLLPLAIIVSGALGVTKYIAVRQKKYKLIAVSHAQQFSAIALLQYLFGSYNVGALGLIIGKIFGDFIGLLKLSGVLKDCEFRLRVNYLKCVAKRYQKFPKFSVFETLANTLTIQLPVMLFASILNASTFGCLVLAMKLVQTPMGFVGKSVSQVYFAQAVEKHRIGKLGSFTEEVLLKLITIGAMPMLCVGLFSKPLITLIFGADWSYVGYAVTMMLPWFILQFLASPISMSMHITGNQPKALYLNIFGLLIRNAFLLIGFYLPYQLAFEAYAFSGVIFYSVCLYFFCSISNVSFSRLKLALKPLFFPFFVSIFISLLLRIILLAIL